MRTQNTSYSIIVLLIITLFTISALNVAAQNDPDQDGSGQGGQDGPNTPSGYEDQKASGDHVASYKVPTPISLDGKISEGEWAQEEGSWMVIGGDVNLSFWSMYDDEYLYFGFEIPDDTPEDMEMVFIGLGT